HLAQGEAGGAMPLLGERLDLVAAGGDQGELRADEERVAGEQDADQQQVHRSSPAGGLISTRSMRRRSMWVTVIRQPSTSTVSPPLGISPYRLRTRPATVSYGPSGGLRPIRRGRSAQ